MPDSNPSPETRPARYQSSSIVLVISGPVASDQVVPLCGRVTSLLERSDADLVVCDVGALDDPDAATVDLVARLQLSARRLDRKVRLLDACGELQDLIELTGLSEFVSYSPDLDLQPRGSAEEGEKAGGVKEKGDAGDRVT